MALDHVTLVTMAADGPSIAHLRLEGILGPDGTVPRGRTFTNGELLELLNATPGRQGPARALARLFDRTVYGGLPAGRAEAEAAIEAAQALATEAAP